MKILKTKFVVILMDEIYAFVETSQQITILWN
jgi:hypothetical protein